MPDEFFNRTPPLAPKRSTPPLRAVLGLSLLTFIGGGALVGWLAWDGKLGFGSDSALDRPAVSASQIAALPIATLSPSASPSAAALAAGGFDQRLAALEQRLTRLDLQAAAAEGNTARAEALLVAFAARRALERGAPLGYLADQLTLRFGAARQAEVATVIAAAKQPVTLESLAGDLEKMAPSLADAPDDVGGWDRLSRELSGLFVIRKANAPSTRPENRLERARMLLHAGQTGAAANEVARLPGGAAAAGWVAAARRYAEVQAALDRIETTALLDPAKLKDADGIAVRQQSPAAPSGVPEGLAPESGY